MLDNQALPCGALLAHVLFISLHQQVVTWEPVRHSTCAVYTDRSSVRALHLDGPEAGSTSRLVFSSVRGVDHTHSS